MHFLVSTSIQGSVSIVDIILMNSNYNIIADLNLDNMINVVDVVQLVNLILNN